MKYFKTITIVLFSLVISLYSCNDNTKTSKQIEVSDSITPPITKAPNLANAEPAQNATGVWHYTCIKGCAGGAGAAVKCDNCGSLLTHNTVYHAKANDTANSTPASSAPFATPAPAAAKAPEPSQNAAGVWHYTCAKGCAGGSGATGPCATCGSTLSHNTAYH